MFKFHIISILYITRNRMKQKNINGFMALRAYCQLPVKKLGLTYTAFRECT